MVNLYGIELEARLRLEQGEARARTARLLASTRPEARPRWQGVKRGLGDALVRLGTWIQGRTDPGWAKEDEGMQQLAPSG